MKSLIEILREEIDHWQDIKENSNNRLLVRTAKINIAKRVHQIGKLKRGVVVKPITINPQDF